MTKRNSNRNTGKLVARILLRTLLVLFTVILLLVFGAYTLCNLIFNGPSPAARDVLTMSMLESSGMKWFPALFIGEEAVKDIQSSVSATLPDDVSNSNQVVIQDGSSSIVTEEWKDYPDGIRVENVYGDTYNAYVMLIRNPADVYMSTSSDPFSMDVPGTRIHQQILKEGAIAAINAGAFYDDGTTSTVVGSVPAGLVLSGGKVVYDANHAIVPQEGFVGFTHDNVLIVAKSMTAEKAVELGIRDGCEFGPVLIMNGQINEEAYNSESGLNPRTAIGQRADGAVIFLCVDGRQASSLGGTYADLIDIMVEYGAVNACNLDGGSSTVMMYRDPATGQVSMVNNYSLLQKEPRRMPTFFMVRPLKEG